MVTEKLAIILGLEKTNLTKSTYFKACGIARSTFIKWQNFYMQDGLKGLKEQHNWTQYSSEIKRQAISVYLNDESSLWDIQIRFGLRSTRRLEDWINELLVHIMSRKTTFEERIRIVEYITVSEHAYSRAATHFNVSYQQVRFWVFKTHANGYIALKDQLGRTKPIEEMTEVERLRLKKRQLKTQIKEQEV